MFDVLMYLFETYIHSDADVMVEQDELTDELSRAGFDKEEIDKALDWLERLANLHDSEREVYVTASAQGSMRIYAPQELARLSTECRGFLLFLEGQGAECRNPRDLYRAPARAGQAGYRAG